jgi:hypothetical protein
LVIANRLLCIEYNPSCCRTYLYSSLLGRKKSTARQSEYLRVEADGDDVVPIRHGACFWGSSITCSTALASVAVATNFADGLRITDGLSLVRSHVDSEISTGALTVPRRLIEKPLHKERHIIDYFIIVDEYHFLIRDLETVAVRSQLVNRAAGKGVHLAASERGQVKR